MPVDRYARQTVLPGIGAVGQARISQSRVLIIGAGGLGCPAALYLAAAGVGTLGLVDGDLVDRSNLQRQVLFTDADVGRPKVDAAADRLRALNPDIQVLTHRDFVTSHNALQLFGGYDLLVDGTDNFAAKFLINDAAVKLGLPVVHGTLSQYEGRVAVFYPPHGPCYRCLHPTPPSAAIQNCAEAGVIGGVAGIIGSAQAVEALKLIVSTSARGQPPSPGPLQPLIGHLFVLDTTTLESQRFPVARRPTCSVCSIDRSAIQLVDLPGTCAVDAPLTIRAEELAHALSQYVTVDVREAHEWAQGHLAGALHFPLSRFEKGERPQLPADNRPVVLVCRSGRRSSRALSLWSGLSRPLLNLQGGLDSWQGTLAKD